MRFVYMVKGGRWGEKAILSSIFDKMSMFLSNILDKTSLTQTWQRIDNVPIVACLQDRFVNQNIVTRKINFSLGHSKKKFPLS